MRDSTSTMTRVPVVSTLPQSTPPNSHGLPSIRLISATPSAAGLSSEASTSFQDSLNSSWASVPSIPSPLAPKSESTTIRPRLVPKKSKLGLLGGKEKSKGKDLSDVTRRIGAGSGSARGGFEIYVDPINDPELSDIMVVKKQKSRAGLDGMAWGALGQVTNIPQVTKKEAPALLKVKEEKEKWWSIGRGRKDSKEKEKEKEKLKENKAQETVEKKLRAKSPEPVREPYQRSKTPEPLKVLQESRARFNSLDSGILLSTPGSFGPVGGQFARAQDLPIPPRASDPPSEHMSYSRSGTPTFGGLLAPPTVAGAPNQGSIALRAMRSVRSIARIGSWAQLKNSEEKEKEVPVPKKEKERSVKVKEKKEGKEKKEKKEKGEEKGEEKKKKKKEKKEAQAERDATVRHSSSSFEVGALTASPEVAKSLGRKKHSILGLGIPSSMRLQTMRSGSTASSTMQPSANRLSVESAAMMSRGRSGSVLSTASSLRPLSTTSTISRTSSGSSGASVRWDEEGLETVKEQRRKERRALEKADPEKQKRREERESRRNSDGRKRTPLSEVFPETRRTSLDSMISVRPGFPIVTVESATSDGHGRPDSLEILDEEQEHDLVMETPAKRARPRPLSEQLLGRSRPKPMYENEDGVLSILDAATNDLALLINHLDLEATPTTPDMTPLRPSPLLSDKQLTTAEYDGSPKKKKTLSSTGSPLKGALRASMASISSLRPYGQSRGSVKAKVSADFLVGQQIAPWPTSLRALSPLKESPKPPSEATPPTPKARPTHKRTMTPGPEPEPSPVFQPLRPAKSRTLGGLLHVASTPIPDTPPLDGTFRAPSSLTFGSRSSSRADSRDSPGEGSPTPSPVFKRAEGHVRKRSSLVPVTIEHKASKGSNGSKGSKASKGSRGSERNSMPIPPEARRVLGMTGTMGGSDVSGYNVPELDASDPDSDIPDELQVLLSEGVAHSENDTFSYQTSIAPGSPRLPPFASLPSPVLDMELPVELPSFHLIDDHNNHGDIDEGNGSSEEDTKKSFDFTGELQKLNESGGSDRRSFVEQLENAFRTPAKVDLRYDFGGVKDSRLQVEVPPVPSIPIHLNGLLKDNSASQSSSGSSFDSYSASRIVDMKEPTLLHLTQTENSEESKSKLDSFAMSRIVDVKEPTLLIGSDSLVSDPTPDSLLSVEGSQSLRASTSSTSSRPSDGQLNVAFKFGGRPTMEPVQPLVPRKAEGKPPMTLSDIIPPPTHVRSLSDSAMLDEDDSVLKSIFAKITDIPAPRARVDSDTSSRRLARAWSKQQMASEQDDIPSASRRSSGISFAGFESFDEVRRGFEFNSTRPTFHPPPGATRRVNHRQRESLFSIASVSSYGRVVNPGVPDPFDYGLPSLRERPSSEDMSMSMSVDDTFSFLDRMPRRKRVESDASSFYFKAPVSNTSFSRGHRRQESNMSVASLAPPISLYNRSFGHHRRNDSNASISFRNHRRNDSSASMSFGLHRRNDSNTSASSVAQSYAMFGAGGGRAAWARHRQDASMDSVMSDFSAMRLGRPGIGDKMFDTNVDHGMPLESISASPPESSRAYGHRSSFDSILDDERRSSMDDSLFDKTGNRSSVSSESVFGDDYSHPPQHGHLLLPPQFRPISVLSMNSVHSPMKEDDTMISMIGGGGRVRRRSVSSLVDASPCVRVEKRKHAAFQEAHFYLDNPAYQESPNKARIIEKPSIASTSSFKFGGERMISAQRGLLARQSLEESCLIADGEDLSVSLRPIAVFSRPNPAARSRSSTCTSSSGGDTPPLSASDGSSISGDSQSSIDLSHVNMILANATHPMTSSARDRVRARARGNGHRRRVSAAQASRSSVYETIQEEMSAVSSPAQTVASKASSPTTCQAVFIVDEDTASIANGIGDSIWDDERGIVALRKYYALRDEAVDTVTQSKQTWSDTPFSVYALQSFQAPRHPAGMQALLEHSVQNYGPLPSELRPRRVRSRTQSRPSPYPQGRVMNKISASPEQSRQTIGETNANRSFKTPVLQQKPVHMNVPTSTVPSLDVIKNFSPFVLDVEPKRENAFGLAPNARPRVASTTRRTALGWSKRSTGKASTELKENVGQGITMTPGESLRINRPRPRGRATPASVQRPIRV